MPPDQKAFTAELIKQIQDINGNPALAPWQKKKAISELSGASRQDMFDYLNKNFRTGPGLSAAISTHVSKDKPRGAPNIPKFISKITKKSK